MQRCSDPNDASSSYVMRGGYAFIVPPTAGFRARWAPGDTVTWLKATAGTPDAIIEFIPPAGYY